MKSIVIATVAFLLLAAKRLQFPSIRPTIPPLLRASCLLRTVAVFIGSMTLVEFIILQTVAAQYLTITK